MRKKILSLLSMGAFVGSLAAQAAVSLEHWDFNVADGSTFNQAPSVPSGITWGNTPLAVITNGTAEFSYDGATDGTFQGKGVLSEPTNGIYEVSYTVPIADFSATAAATATAQWGFGLRDNQTAVTPEKTSVVPVFKYDSFFRIQVWTGTSWLDTRLAPNGQTSIANVSVRLVYDLTVDTLTIFHSVDGAAETSVSGSIPAHFAPTDAYLQIQTTNGGQNWQPSDYVRVDDLIYSEVPQAAIFIAAQSGTGGGGGDYAIGSTNDLAAFDVEAGDMVVVVSASNVDSTPTTNDLTMSGSAVMGNLVFDRKESGAGPSSAYWYVPVESNGTLDLVYYADNYACVGAYLVRATNGATEVASVAVAGSPSTGSLTNSYTFAVPTNGILFEARSSYSADGVPQLEGMGVDYENWNSGRQVASADFSAGTTTLESVWTQSDGTKGTALTGVAVVMGDAGPVPEPTPEELYNDWLFELGYTANTEPLDDASGNGVKNQVEYAIGGGENLPVGSFDGTYLTYVHVQWDIAEAASRGLAYEVQASASLTDAGTWGTNAVELVGSADDVPEVGMQTVTNRVLVDGDAQFMKLKITLTK